MASEKKNRQEETEQQNDRQETSSAVPSLRYQQIYDLLDAVVDGIKVSGGRRRAIKYGIRAVGEIVFEYMEESRQEERPAAKTPAVGESDHQVGEMENGKPSKKHGKAKE